MRAYDELIREAVEADVDGWGWGFLDGRATEERPPWGFSRLLAERLAAAPSALDLDTGGGEVLDSAPALPPRMVATEGWAPNLVRVRARLQPRGVEVVETVPGAPLPLPDASFALVTARHPVRPDWAEIARVLEPGGRYLAQHVGPASAFELIEQFTGPLVEERLGRDPRLESAAAIEAGLRIVSLRTARLRMTFVDIGAVVWTLRRCVWWVPDFAIERYEPVLRRLDARLRAGEPFVAHSTRHLIEAERPTR